MSNYDFRYVDVTSLPSRLSDFDLQQFFQLSKEDVLALNNNFRIDRRAGVAILLLFLRAAGRTLDQVAAIPRPIPRYVGATLSVKTPTIASLRALYKRPQTFYQHQLWVKEYLELKDVDQTASDQLFSHIQAHASEVVALDELVTSARLWLYEHKFLIPHDRQIRDLALICYDSVEKHIYHTMRRLSPAEHWINVFPSSTNSEKTRQ